MRGSGPQALHLVSALARAQGLCLALVATAGKSYKLADLPAVLALLDLSGGTLVSLDSMACPPAIATQIVTQRGHNLLALKRNQPGLCGEAEWALAGVVPQHTATGWTSHNTPVRWHVTVQSDLRWAHEGQRWPALATLIRVETSRYAGGTLQAQSMRYYLMLRTDLCELLIHGFQANTVELGFEAEMAKPTFKLEHFQFDVSQYRRKKSDWLAWPPF
uniref:ISAs1 family transposase n=1 Tax=Hymenobacter aerophilus TaxID=119644 RepID=UPI00035D1A4E|nr:ISAs1 family transposase [Hymenobacter aerophilus]